jgi:hypothetical protein
MRGVPRSIAATLPDTDLSKVAVVSFSWEEYRGYVVLASPSMGASTRDMTDDLAGIDTQALDISFLIS